VGNCTSLERSITASSTTTKLIEEKARSPTEHTAPKQSGQPKENISSKAPWQVSASQAFGPRIVVWEVGRGQGMCHGLRSRILHYGMNSSVVGGGASGGGAVAGCAASSPQDPIGVCSVILP
jgi:hypothetical protein